jgi:hypothetical protein
MLKVNSPIGSDPRERLVLVAVLLGPVPADEFSGLVAISGAFILLLPTSLNSRRNSR